MGVFSMLLDEIRDVHGHLVDLRGVVLLDVAEDADVVRRHVAHAAMDEWMGWTDGRMIKNRQTNTDELTDRRTDDG